MDGELVTAHLRMATPQERKGKNQRGQRRRENTYSSEPRKKTEEKNKNKREKNRNTKNERRKRKLAERKT
jgi:hypothetical protein